MIDRTLAKVAAGIVLIGTVLVLALGCAAQDSRPASRPVVKPGPTLVDIGVDRLQAFTSTQPPKTEAELFALWASQTLRVLCERFEVPTPLWELEPGLPASTDCTLARIYTPATSTIRVYAGSTPAMKRYTFFHGFLHHLHRVRGVNHVPGHDMEFDRWMKVLGLVP